MTTMDLSDFLLARIAERERWAAREGLLRGYRDGEPGGPAHDLADCDAKRRIVEHEAGGPRKVSGSALQWTYTSPVLALLALPYADHPDYREEWRP